MKYIFIIISLSFLLFVNMVKAQDDEETTKQHREEREIEKAEGEYARQLREELPSTESFTIKDLSNILSPLIKNLLNIPSFRQEKFTQILNYVDAQAIPLLEKQYISGKKEDKFSLAAVVLAEPRCLPLINQDKGFNNYSVEKAVNDMTDLAVAGNVKAQYTLANMILQKDHSSEVGIRLMASAAIQGNNKAIQYMRSRDVYHFDENYLDYAKKNHILSPSPKVYEAFLDHVYDSLVQVVLQTGDWQSFKRFLLNNGNFYTKFYEMKKKEGKKLHPAFVLFEFDNKWKNMWYLGAPNIYFLIKQCEDIIAQKARGKGDFKQYPISVEQKILGDIYATYVLFRHDATVRFPMANFQKAIDYYQQSADAGNGASCLLAARLLLLQKDSIKAFQYYQKAFQTGNKDVYSDLAYCYEAGIAIKVDTSLASKLYKIALYNGDYTKSMAGLTRLKSSIITNFSTQVEYCNLFDIMETVLKDTAKVKVVHFWNAGPDIECYNTMIQLCKANQSTSFKGAKLYLAGISHNEELLPNILGYNNTEFGIPYLRYQQNEKIYTDYYQRIYGFEPPIEILENTYFLPYPEFDKRWIDYGFPATIVFIKNKESLYFNAKTPYTEIEAAINDELYK